MPQANGVLYTDVLVIGFGCSGGAAAIAAAEAGARTVIVEKMSVGGGSSAAVPGLVCVPSSMRFAGYLEVLDHAVSDRGELEALCRQAMRFPDWVEHLGGSVETASVGGAFPGIPGGEDMSLVEVTLSSEHCYRSSAHRMFALIDREVKRAKIPVFFDTEAVELITEEGAVVGAVVKHKEEVGEIRASMGVILACGGYAGNPELMRETALERPITNLGNPGNTGDGIIMAARVGAALRKLSVLNTAGLSYLPPHYPVGAPLSFGESPVCFVDRGGREFLEDAPFTERNHTAYAEMRHFDFRRMRFDRNPCYAIFDERTMGGGPLSRGGYFQNLYTWSDSNRAELDKGWILRADSAETLAERLGLDPDVLRETLERFFASRGGQTGQLYAMEVTLGTMRTTGGPRRDPQMRVLNWGGAPIPGLYAVGECGSALGLVYQSGMFLAEAAASGTIAGETIVADNL